MKRTHITNALIGSALFAACSGPTWADDAPPAVSNDRLVFSASALTLTNTDGGGGASATWLHNFNPDTIVGIGGDYQTVAHAHWQFASLTAAYGFGPAAYRTNLYAEAHEGGGTDTGRSFDYSIVTAGFYQNVTRQLALQFEDKQIDVDATHGNLPKFGIQYLWSPSLLTNVAYSHSVSGGLGTRLYSARLDYYGKKANLIVGGATGQATARVLNLQDAGLSVPGLNAHEGFIGVAKTFAGVEVTVLGDYLKLGDSERVTLTVNGAVPLRSRGRSR